MTRSTAQPAPMTIVAIAILGLTTVVIVAAVVWALPMWFWTFVVGLAAGAFAERRWSHRRHAS